MIRRHRNLAIGLGLSSLVGWLVLATGDRVLMLARFCDSRSWRGWDEALTLLRMNGPEALLFTYSAMVAAMMAPMLLNPLRHVSDRSFPRCRAVASASYCVGYIAVWLLAAPVLWLSVAVLQLNLANSLVPPSSAALVLLLGWHMTPWRQEALNRCHVRRVVSGQVHQAMASSLLFGGEVGLACAAACLPVMLVTMLAGDWHVSIMLVACGYLWAERQLPPERLQWGPANIRRTAVRLGYWYGQFVRRSLARPWPRVTFAHV